MRRRGVGMAVVGGAVVVVIIVIALVFFVAYHPGTTSTTSSAPASVAATLTPSLSASSSPSSPSSTTTSTLKSTISEPSSSASINSTAANSPGGIQTIEWVKAIDNVASNATSFYTSSSMIAWTGNINNSEPVLFSGNWAGLSGFSYHWGLSLGLLTPSPDLVTISNLTVTNVGGGNINATFHLVLNGTSSQYGLVSATANVQLQWTSGGGVGGYYLHYETWNFAKTYVQYPQNDVIIGG